MTESPEERAREIADELVDKFKRFAPIMLDRITEGTGMTRTEALLFMILSIQQEMRQLTKPYWDAYWAQQKEGEDWKG